MVHFHFTKQFSYYVGFRKDKFICSNNECCNIQDCGGMASTVEVGSGWDEGLVTPSVAVFTMSGLWDDVMGMLLPPDPLG